MTGKQLKNSILQWAIQGKLVPQDPNDESASVLLEKIRAEKARLIKEGKIKKDKKESIIYRGEDNSYYEKFADGKVVCIDDEIPFEIPKGWEWCRISHLFLHTSGKQQNYTNKDKGAPQRFITTSNLYWGRFVLDNVKVMNFTKEEIETCSATKGDLLVCEGGAGYGRSAIWDKDYDICLQNHIHRLRPYVDGICEYIYYFIYFLKESNQLASVGTAMPGLSANRLKKLLLPLPPHKEQKHIVDKLIKGMSLLERYGDIEEVLSELNVKFPVNLRKSILQEAIQGKLVPQDPNDEPASVLLQRIKKEKQRLVKEGKLKKKDIVDSLIFKGDDNKYYEQIDGIATTIESDYDFPNTWEVVRLSHICRLIDGEKKEGQFTCLDAKYLRGKSTGIHLDKGKFVTKGDNIILVDGENSGEVFAVPHEGYMGSTFKQLWVSEAMHLPYVLYFIQFYKDLLRNSKKGAAIPHLNKEIFYSLLIGIPPYQEQKRIAKRIKEITNKIKD